MKVYIVKKIIDHEYGCRDVEAVFATEELANEYIDNSEDNFEYEFWNGSIESNLIIEEYEVYER